MVIIVVLFVKGVYIVTAVAVAAVLVATVGEAASMGESKLVEPAVVVYNHSESTS
jgi:hypothetical protein